jgi:HlyD family secretion protein
MDTRRTALLSLLVLAACGEPAPAGWSGYVEGEYVYVAAPVAGAVVALAVQGGQAVATGAPLFTLESEAEQAAVEEAAARREAAQAQARNTASGLRAEELAVLRAQLEQARTRASFTRSELVRQQQLHAQGFVSAARVEDAETAAAQAAARVAELQAALDAARLAARPDERAAARATAEAADAALRASRWRVQQKQQAAPAGGVVADTYFRVGEWVAAGQPVVALLPAGAVKARFFVPEAELAALAPGQPVTIRCDGCGEPIAARVSFVATRAEYTPPVIYSNSQRARLVFMVEARPEPGAAAAARLRQGLPVDVRPGAP